MQLQEIGKKTIRQFPFMGGPMDGQMVTVRGDEHPHVIRCQTYVHHVEYLDDRMGGLPSEWKKVEGADPIAWLGSVTYVWSESTCAYVVKDLPEVTPAK